MLKSRMLWLVILVICLQWVGSAVREYCVMEKGIKKSSNKE